MGYSAGFLHDVIQVLNRKEAKTSKFGIDGGGVEWEEGPCLHANVDYARGKAAMNAGALDAYAVKIVRMRYNTVVTDRCRIKYERYNTVVTDRCRIKYDGRVFQILPETFHQNRLDDTLQFHMQLIVNDK